MLKVALTGNIASGKSSVARVWASLGATVVDADRLARAAVEPGTPALAAIVARWGPRVLDGQGRLDRSTLRDIVFADPGERRRLEAIVHPAVGALREAEYRRAESRGDRVIVADIPLLFEVGLEGEFDRVVLVDAPEEIRLARIVHDRSLTPAQAASMIAAQMPAARKRARADLIIDNDGTVAELERRAREVWEDIVVGA